MISTELLLYWAQKMDIKVVFEKLHPNLLGKADAMRKIITLDLSLKDKPRSLKCILAHELGHILFPPRPGHVRYHSKGFWHSDNCGLIKTIVAQDERKALDWATNILIPNVEFYRIIEDVNCTLWEMEEIFDVESWIVEHKIGYYRRKAWSMR